MKRLDSQRKNALRRLQARRERRRLSRLGKVYSPGKRGLSAASQAEWTRVTAPGRLDFGDSFSDSLKFLDRVREVALTAERGVFIDLKHCTYISAVIGLMLCAEIERCRGLRFGCVNGCDPDQREPKLILRAIGFHRRLGIARGAPESSHIVTIRSGGKGDVSRELEHVSHVARRAFRDSAFANRVHGTLNEAMLNVSMHAYNHESFDPTRALADRWWVAGVANPEKGEVIFFAYDHGVGIATTAPRNLGEDLFLKLDQILIGLGLKRSDALDHHIIQAAIKSKQSSTGLPQHGKGLTSLVQLVDRAKSGAVWICSGAGQYLYSRLDPDAEPVEVSQPLAYSVPGTLIVWRLKSAPAVEGTASHAHAA